MNTLKRVFIIVALAAVLQVVQSLHVGEQVTSRAGLLVVGIGFVLVASLFVGRIAASVGLPKLTGYLATGIITGPALLSYLDADTVSDMKLVNGMAISLIALTAGSEMDFRAMKPLMRSIAWITAFGVVGTALVLAVVVFLMSGEITFLAHMTHAEAAAASLVVGVVVVAQSPAVVVALRSETGADGPVARTVLGVVIVADLVVILLFAIASTIANATFAGSFDVRETLHHFAWEIGGSLVIGAVVGGIIAAWQRFVGKSGLDLFVLAACFVSAEVGQRLELDPLLIMLAAGLVVENIARKGEELRHAFADASMPVYILFFTVAGASIHLEALPSVVVPAVALVLTRGLGLYGGTWLGAHVAKAPSPVKRFAGFGLLPQAGLAIALSLLFARTFPQFGEDAAALTLSIVALNEIIAPAIFRVALVRSGEARASSAGSIPPAAPVAPPPADADEATPPPAGSAPEASATTRA